MPHWPWNFVLAVVVGFPLALGISCFWLMVLVVLADVFCPSRLRGLDRRMDLW